MKQAHFTGERIHDGDELFAVDLAKHRAAYRFALQYAVGGDVLDLGCGSGYGTLEFAGVAARVLGVDRVFPDETARRSSARFVLADLRAIPLAPSSFDLIVSFQVIEHLEDPSGYLEQMAGLLRPGGRAILTTPNRLTSDGENPYHVREYSAEEISRLLRRYFDVVEMLGVGQSQAAATYHSERLRKIRLITRLDPFRLRKRILRPLAEWCFARFARHIRRSIKRGHGLPEVTWRDFPIGPAGPLCLDLVAVCQ